MTRCSLLLDCFEFKKTDIESAIINNRLLSLEIEFSRHCNLRCQYCYNPDTTNFQSELTIEEIHDILLQAKELGARKIIILGGEPMLYPRIMEMLHYIRREGLEVAMFTNGACITDKIAHLLFQLDVFVVLKMDSRIEKVQDALSGKKGAYVNIQEALKNLQQAGYPGRNTKLAVSTILCQDNIDEIPSLWEWLRDRNIIPYFEMITPKGRASTSGGLHVPNDKLKEVFYKLSEIDREKHKSHWYPQPPLVGIKCMRHQFSCTVTAHGDVYPCVGVNIAVGNIRERKLATILGESEVVHNLRNYRNHIKGPCRECNKFSDCYGCRGAAYHLTGDYLASDPRCWNNANRQNDIVHLPVEADRIIPQKAPMRVIDRLEKVAERTGEVTVRISNDMLFVQDDGTLDEAVYMELIAQSVAALTGFKNLGANNEVVDGFLLGAKKLEILGKAKIGDTLTISIFKYARFGEYGIVKGLVSRGDELLAQGEVTIWQKFKNKVMRGAVTMVILCSVLFVSDAYAASDVKTILLRLEKRMAEVKTLETNFRQEKRLSVFTHPVTLTGKIFIQKPKYFSWRSQSPVRYCMLIKDDVVKQWDEESNQIQQLSLSRNPGISIAIEQMKIWFSGPYDSLRNDYEVRVITEEPTLLEFIPIQSNPAFNLIKSVRASFEKDERYLREIKIEEKNGDSTSLTFSSVKLNIPINPSVWEMEPDVR